MHPLKQRIKKMLVERLFLSVEPDQIGDDTPLMETYNVDSVALFEIVVGVEDEFGVAMDDTEFSIDSFRTVNAIADIVGRKGGS